MTSSTSAEVSNVLSELGVLIRSCCLLRAAIVTYQSGRKELEAGLIRAFPHGTDRSCKFLGAVGSHYCCAEEEGIRKYMKAVYGMSQYVFSPYIL